MGSLYINKFFFAFWGGLGTLDSFFWKKNLSQQKNKKTLLHNIFQREPKQSFLFHQKAFIRTKSKKNFFSPYFLLKTTFKSNKRLQSQFSSQEQIKTVNTLWREINTASTSFSTPFFIIFLFCLISYLIQFIFIFVLIIY